MSEAIQVAHAHSETVIQRHRNANPVAETDADRFSDEKRVVQDVSMRQGCALRRSGRAARELNVDGVFGLQRCADFAQPIGMRFAPAAVNFREWEYSPQLRRIDAHDHLEVGKRRRREHAWLIAEKFRGEFT